MYARHWLISSWVILTSALPRFFSLKIEVSCRQVTCWGQHSPAVFALSTQYCLSYIIPLGSEVDMILYSSLGDVPKCRHCVRSDVEGGTKPSPVLSHNDARRNKHVLVEDVYYFWGVVAPAVPELTSFYIQDFQRQTASPFHPACQISWLHGQPYLDHSMTIWLPLLILCGKLMCTGSMTSQSRHLLAFITSQCV